MANDKIICKCYKVTEKDIKKAIKKGAESAKETKADTACRHCTKKFEKTVKDLLK